MFFIYIYISGHQFDFGVISLVDEDRGMTSEIDRSGSLIELVKGTLFDETPLAAYHPLGVWHTHPVVWVA